MSAYYLYLGGCVAIGSAYLLASKIFHPTDVRDSVRLAIEGVTNNTRSTEDSCGENDLDDAVRGINLYSKKRQQMLEKELNQAKAMLAELQIRYGLHLNEPAAAKETDATVASSKKRQSKSKKRESIHSGSSSDGVSKPATVVLKMSSDKQSSGKCAGNDASSAEYNDAENASTISTVLSEQESVPEDPLVGNREVEPIEKVEKWLYTSTEKQDPAVKNFRHATRSKPIVTPTMTKNLSANKKESRDGEHDECITSRPSLPKRESPKKLAPHLYKRLLLRKKSCGPVEETPRARSKSRNKTPETTNKLQSKPEEKRKKTGAPNKNFTSEPDLRKKKHGVKQKLATDAASDKCSELGYKSENEDDTASDYNNDKYVDQSNSDVCSVVEPTNDSSDDHMSQKTESSKKNKKGVLLNWFKLSPISLSKSPPVTERMMTPETINAVQSTHSKLKTSQTPLLRKIDEVLELKSTTFDKNKPIKAKNQRNESAQSLNRPSTDARQTLSTQQDGPESEEEKDTKIKSIDMKKEFQSKHNMKLSRSNQEKHKSDGSTSDEEGIWGTKSKSTDKKKEFKAKNNMKLSRSNQEKHMSDGSNSGEEVVLDTNPKITDKKKEFKAKNNMKLSHSNQEKPKSDGSNTDEEVVCDTKSKPSDKTKEFQAKMHMKFSCSNQERPKLGGAESLCPNTIPSDKRKEVHGKDHIKDSGSHERPKSSGSEISSAKNVLERRKEFLDKNQMKDSSCQERPKPADCEEFSTKANPFDKRKLFQAKYQIKDAASMPEGRKADEREILPPSANQFEKRKEFEAKYHIKDTPNENGSEAFEKGVSNTKANPFDKRKDYQAKYHMKDFSNKEDVASTEGFCTKSRSEKRKDFLAQYQKKAPSRSSRSNSPENEGFCAKANAHKKRKDLESVSIQSSRKPAEKQPLYAKAAAKVTPLQRRMEYDSKFRMNFVSSNQSVRNSIGNEELRVKTSLLEKRKDDTTNLKMKEADSSLDRPAAVEKLATAKTTVEDDVTKCVTGPTMNRLPNDTTRKAYLFDWESKRYAVASKPDTVVNVGSEIEQKKSRGSSIPPKGKRLLPPRNMKRPLSAGGTLRNNIPPTSVPPKKHSPNFRDSNLDSEDDGSIVGERSMGSKSISNYDFHAKTKPFKPPLPNKSFSYKQYPVNQAVELTSEYESEDGLVESEDTSLGGKSSSDWGFDPKELDDCNLSNHVNSEESEETMIKDLKKNEVEFNSMEPSSVTMSDDDVGEARERDLDEFVFPKCPSDFLPKEYNTRPKLQNVLDLPMHCRGPSYNDNLLSRSESGINSEDDASLSGSTVTNASLITNVTPTGKFRRGSSEELAVLTDGYRQLALETILDDSFKD